MNHPNLRVQYKEKRSCENRETFIVMCKLIIKHLIKNKLREKHLKERDCRGKDRKSSLQNG